MLDHGYQIDGNKNKMTESLRGIQFPQIYPKAVKKNVFITISLGENYDRRSCSAFPFCQLLELCEHIATVFFDSQNASKLSNAKIKSTAITKKC